MAGNGKWDDTVSTLGLYHDMEGTPVYNSQLWALVCVADCGSFQGGGKTVYLSYRRYETAECPGRTP